MLGFTITGGSLGVWVACWIINEPANKNMKHAAMAMYLL